MQYIHSEYLMKGQLMERLSIQGNQQIFPLLQSSVLSITVATVQRNNALLSFVHYKRDTQQANKEGYALRQTRCRFKGLGPQV